MSGFQTLHFALDVVHGAHDEKRCPDNRNRYARSRLRGMRIHVAALSDREYGTGKFRVVVVLGKQLRMQTRNHPQAETAEVQSSPP